MNRIQQVILILSVVGGSIISTAQAQVTIGPRFGVSSSQISIDRTETDEYVLNTGDNKVGLHVGLFSRITMGNFYLQPEVLWTSTGGEIDITRNGVDEILDYQLNKIDVPMMAGLKMGFFRLQAGPVANFLIDEEIDGPLGVDLNEVVFGYQAGIGLDIGNMLVDLKYENNLSRLGNQIEGINVDQRNSQVLLSVGFKLF